MLIKVITGVKTVAGIEFVMVFAMTTLSFAVVARSIRANKLVADTEHRSICLEQSGLIL